MAGGVSHLLLCLSPFAMSLQQQHFVRSQGKNGVQNPCSIMFGISNNTALNSSGITEIVPLQSNKAVNPMPETERSGMVDMQPNL